MLAAAVNSPGSAAPPAAGQIARDQRATHAAAAGISPTAKPKPGTREYEETVRRRLWRAHDLATQDLKDRAAQDAKTARRVKELQDAGYPKGYSIASAAREFGIGGSTIRGWFANELKDIDPKDWTAALLDQRGRRGPTIPAYDQFLFDFYKSDYLRTDRPPRTACYRNAVKAAKARGVMDDQIPAEVTLWRQLKRETTWQAVKYARYGRQAAHSTYPAQTRDRSVLHALECVNGDGYRWNTAVIWPDGELCRPVMFYFQDVFSGMILAWRLDKTENAGVLRMTIGDLISNYSIPDVFVIDNTLAAASKWITGQSPSRHRFKAKPADVFGLIAQLGARHIATLPRVGGSSKPGERAGGDWDRDIARSPALEGSWCGHNTAARPETAREPVPFAKFREIVAAGIKEHNCQPGRRTAVCRGLSFEEVFRESFAKVVVKKPTTEQLRLCMLAAEKVTCREIDGQIKLCGNLYWSETTAQLAGQEVVVRFDPAQLQQSIFV